jgi:putative glutamine amidotransferase
LTNSFHHQAIKDLAPDLIVNARTKDGMIEGVEGKGELFILGVQWHPELMFGKHPSMLKLFHAFVEAARREPTP